MTQRPAEILTGALGSALALLMAFGVNVTDDQSAAILAAVGWVPAIVTACVELWRSRNAPQAQSVGTVGDILDRKAQGQPASPPLPPLTQPDPAIVIQESGWPSGE